MKVFQTKKRGNRVTSRVGVQIQRFAVQKQRKMANYLSRKTQYWNRSSKIIALVLFCLLFGGGYLLLLIKAIIHF